MNFLDEKKINVHLQAFKDNTKEVMNSIPQKFQKNGDVINTPHSAFSQQDIESKHYVKARDGIRSDIQNMEEILEERAAYQPNDMPENLVDTFEHDTLEAIEAGGLMSSTLDIQPWSDDYWAIYNGILGNRYADPSYPSSSDWQENFDYVRQHDANDIFYNSGSAAKIDMLSPSEKYDALIGDKTGALTRRMWLEGKRYYDANGEVESWMGICHGWAPAAYMLDRPTGVATAIAPNNHPIKFYPSDIKALASLLWANIRTPTRFIGGRCNIKEPDTDPETDRIIANQCFDTNPASWHLGIVNQIGVSRRSFVLDATYDYQVWNQPVTSYSYRYFNPESMQYSNSLNDAKVSMGNFNSDPFSNYRSNAGRSVVGIAMEVSYIVETTPNQNITDSSAQDSVTSVTYYYDLELDDNDTVIGGEWYQNAHPDFLWTPVDNHNARTQYDHLASGNWSDNRVMPEIWRHAAKQASANQSAPLGKIVERLIQMSRA